MTKTFWDFHLYTANGNGEKEGSLKPLVNSDRDELKPNRPKDGNYRTNDEYRRDGTKRNKIVYLWRRFNRNFGITYMSRD